MLHAPWPAPNLQHAVRQGGAGGAAGSGLPKQAAAAPTEPALSCWACPPCRVYHQLEPPSYDLGAIATPLTIFHGGRDRLADPQDVATLLRALPPGAVAYSQFVPSYEHIDFTWGIDARERVYPPLLRLLQRHHPPAGPAPP